MGTGTGIGAQQNKGWAPAPKLALELALGVISTDDGWISSVQGNKN